VIHVARLDGTALIVNADLIETIEERPDTVVTLVNGKKFIVREEARELVQRVVDYRTRIELMMTYARLGVPAMAAAGAAS
jgi:flagellar protein FlbD